MRRGATEGSLAEVVGLTFFYRLKNALDDIIYIYSCFQTLWRLCILFVKSEVSEANRVMFSLLASKWEL